MISKSALFASCLVCSWLVAGCDIPESTSGKSRQIAMAEPDAPGAVLLVKYCSDCHAPPAESSHTAEEWPNIVYRMQEQRRMRGLHLMTSEERTVLLEYLQQHAKTG